MGKEFDLLQRARLKLTMGREDDDAVEEEIFLMTTRLLELSEVVTSEPGVNLEIEME